MRILIDSEWHKVGNFIDYLIEHFNEKGKKYKFQLKLEDIYDKRLVNNRMLSLNDRLLLLYEDEFEIINADFKSLKGTNSDMISESKLTKENFNEQIVSYELEFVGDKDLPDLSFKFLK